MLQLSSSYSDINVSQLNPKAHNEAWLYVTISKISLFLKINTSFFWVSLNSPRNIVVAAVEMEGYASACHFIIHEHMQVPCLCIYATWYDKHSPWKHVIWLSLLLKKQALSRVLGNIRNSLEESNDLLLCLPKTTAVK